MSPVSPGVVTLPDEKVTSADYRCVVSLSGGKDSVAVSLALTELGIQHDRVFADTGWEAKETYAHLEVLEARLGKIHRVGVDGGMVAKARQRAGFPARMQRWCTQELKIKPLQEWYHQFTSTTGLETICVVGIRAQESARRSEMLAWEDDCEWGGWMWRPLLDWSVEQVIDIHHRHGVPLNPLYLQGHDRVGCYPCIFSRKDEIRLIAEHAPERIDLIRDLEQETTVARVFRNEAHMAELEAQGKESVPRHKYTESTFFLVRGPNKEEYMPIDKVVEWSKTKRGGRYLELLPVPSGGCFRWGVCEPPGTRVEPPLPEYLTWDDLAPHPP